MSNLFELAKKRRSVRKYTSESINDKVIQNILNVALLAPSSWGRHPVEFLVVKDKEMIEKIAKCKRMGAAPLENATVAIVVFADIKDCELWIEDSSVASTYILLAAEEQGIGACWIHIRNRAGQKTTADEEIRELLNIPNNYSVLNVVALGQKGEIKEARSVNDLHKENIHYEKY